MDESNSLVPILNLKGVKTFETSSGKLSDTTIQWVFIELISEEYFGIADVESPEFELEMKRGMATVYVKWQI